MHNLTKIKIFRVILWMSYPFALVLIQPFVALKKKKKSPLFFFFDRYAIGGAQHVYLDILASIQEKQKTIYFTRQSADDKLKPAFYSLPNVECHDIHIWCDLLLFRIFSVHFFAFYINRHKNAVVLSSNSTFFYDMLPFFPKDTKKIELLHNFSYGKKGMEFFGLANHRFLDYRMVIDEHTKENIINQYREFNVDEQYADRVVLAEYGVDIPSPVVKEPVPPLKILYAGRGTRQKRVWLLNRIAEHFGERKSEVQFSFAGPIVNELSEVVKKHFNVYGEIGDRTVMQQLYATHHIVILTSAFEGFPVVVKEGMSYGCIPLVTALPANETHLQHMENAMLINDYENEESVVKEAMNHIEFLLRQPTLVEQLSANAYAYAQKKFGKQDFIATYRRLLG